MVNGVITPVLLTYILVLANRPGLLGTAATGPSSAWPTISVVVTAVMATAVLA